jgi:hypothetical protein
MAHYYRRLRGPLKYTGTVIFDRSLPIESLIIAHKLIFILGSLKNGNLSLVSKISTSSLMATSLDSSSTIRFFFAISPALFMMFFAVAFSIVATY